MAEHDGFIEGQRAQWSNVAPAWEKWDELLDACFAFVNYRLVGDARIRRGASVLDLGSGTGYPALLAASAVTPGGSVVGVDLSDQMLEVARRKAEDLKLDNIEFVASDVTKLDFADETFNAVLSRFCLMFLPDVPAVLAEIARVLKPGGYLSCAVWSSIDKNPFITLPIKVLSEYVEVPKPDPDAPGIFRLAQEGDLAAMAEGTGLRCVTEEEMGATSLYESEEQYFENLYDLAAPLRPLFD
ncbi:MAG: class I SAM-dependent methyltransferase, partial [Proteobacteria bacterium]|nr:class I SAM-dependent methyltransferase [Pseudomonadota bacterium]